MPLRGHQILVAETECSSVWSKCSFVPLLLLLLKVPPLLLCQFTAPSSPASNFLCQPLKRSVFLTPKRMKSISRCWGHSVFCYPNQMCFCSTLFRTRNNFLFESCGIHSLTEGGSAGHKWNVWSFSSQSRLGPWRRYIKENSSIEQPWNKNACNAVALNLQDHKNQWPI